MAEHMTAVLDASALLAYLFDESGAARVETRIVSGAYVSQVNWIEVLSKLAEHGRDIDAVITTLEEGGILGDALIVQPLDDAQMRMIARLRPVTRSAGLSLGDRACLALAHTLGSPAITCDHSWTAVAELVQVEVQSLR
jgi:PIN domain nuclease of toxin-antitoxin system